jgi:hypothetical protein
MFGYDLRHQREAQPRAVFAPRDEGLEDVLRDLGRDAGTVVDDLDLQGQARLRAVLAAEPQRHLVEGADADDAAALPRRLGRVLEKVLEHLQHLVAVRPGGGSEGSYSSTNFMFAAKPTIADLRARSRRSWTLTAFRSGGLRLPNCSTCSRSFTIRRASPTMRSVRSRSSPSRFIDRSCAAPVIPASGFLISCASISAMPMADLAADLAECARVRRSAVERVSISRRTKPGIPIIGAICMLHCTGGLSPQDTSTLLMKSIAWSDADAAEAFLDRRVDGEAVEDRRALERPGGDVEERFGREVDLGDDVAGVEQKRRDGQRGPELFAEGLHAASA